MKGRGETTNVLSGIGKRWITWVTGIGKTLGGATAGGEGRDTVKCAGGAQAIRWLPEGTGSGLSDCPVDPSQSMGQAMRTNKDVLPVTEVSKTALSRANDA